MRRRFDTHRPDPEVPFERAVADRFEILRVVERGAQGIVYQARVRRGRAMVALKRLVPRATEPIRDRRRFEREVDLVARLTHPNIVRVRESAVACGYPYHVTDWVEGRSLDLWVAEVQPPLATRLVLFRKVCDAVAHAHRRGVIHRDLKPGNVLVDQGGEPHVLDFGVAAGAMHLQFGGGGEGFVGTLSYASPERRAGDPGAGTAADDAYSLGVILFELATGRLPAPPDVADGRARRRGREREVDPGSELDAGLRAVLERALAGDSKWRYRTVEELLGDLDRAIAGRPIAPWADRGGGLWRRWLRGRSR